MKTWLCRGGDNDVDADGSHAVPGPAPSAEAPKPPEVVQPKAALQQHCQRAGWPAPRFERLPPGGMRLEVRCRWRRRVSLSAEHLHSHRLASSRLALPNTRPAQAGGYRYSVVIEVPAPARGPKKKAAQGPRTVSLRERDDGWERVEDAQSAAATRALFELAREGDVQHRLPEVFQELWAQWEGEGEAAPAEASQEEEEARQAFILSLVDGAAAAAAAAAGGAGRGGGAGGAGEEVPSSGSARERWEAQLVRALEAAPAQSAAQQEDSRRMQAELRAFRESPEGAKWQADRSRCALWCFVSVRPSAGLLSLLFLAGVGELSRRRGALTHRPAQAAGGGDPVAAAGGAGGARRRRRQRRDRQRQDDAGPAVHP